LLSVKVVPRRSALGPGCLFLFAFTLLQWRLPIVLVLALHCMAGAALVFVAARLPASLSAMRPLPVLGYLGVRSYTIYICHFPILTFLSGYCLQVVGRRPMSGWLALGGAGIALAASVVLFEFCEKRFLHRGAKGTPRTAETPLLVAS